MFRSVFCRALLALTLVQGAWLVSGCSEDATPTDGLGASGTLTMPLRAAAGAHTYRLIGTLQVSGSTYAYVELGEHEEIARVVLPTGNYNASLYYWSLYREDPAGNLLPVAASLVSSSSQYFSIFNQTTTTVSFQFETDGHIVTVGSGALNVAIDVDETPAACTPLGSDCPSGAWCAPAELTGQGVSCILAGSLEPGAACAAPTDCIANASCFDFGQGAACALLCLATELGQPCVGGGTCMPQGIEYGVCVPDSPTP